MAGAWARFVGKIMRSARKIARRHVVMVYVRRPSEKMWTHALATARSAAIRFVLPAVRILQAAQKIVV